MLTLDTQTGELARAVIDLARQKAANHINLAALEASGEPPPGRAILNNDPTKRFLHQLSSKQMRRLLASVKDFKASRSEQNEQRVDGRGLLEQANRQIDSLYAAFLSITTLLKFNILRNARANKAFLFGTIGQGFFTVIGHYYIFYIIHHPIPPELPILAYTMPAFSSYVMFAHAMYKSSGKEHTWLVFSGRRIGSVPFHLANFLMEIGSILIACILCIVFLYVVGASDVRSVEDSFKGSNVGMFVCLLTLAYVLGYGLGTALDDLFTAIPGLNGTIFMLMPVIFITSGVYSSYNGMPALIKEVFRINPLLTVVEKARESMVIGYSTPDLTLIYPLTIAAFSLAFALMHRTRKERLAQ